MKKLDSYQSADTQRQIINDNFGESNSVYILDSSIEYINYNTSIELLNAIQNNKLIMLNLPDVHWLNGRYVAVNTKIEPWGANETNIHISMLKVSGRTGTDEGSSIIESSRVLYYIISINKESETVKVYAQYASYPLSFEYMDSVENPPLYITDAPNGTLVVVDGHDLYVKLGTKLKKVQLVD